MGLPLVKGVRSGDTCAHLSSRLGGACPWAPSVMGLPLVKGVRSGDTCALGHYPDLGLVGEGLSTLLGRGELYGGLEVAFARGERGPSPRGPLGGSLRVVGASRGGVLRGVGDDIWPGVV
jgi:hypothetical protein